MGKELAIMLGFCVGYIEFLPCRVDNSNTMDINNSHKGLSTKFTYTKGVKI